ncbi:MAG: ankyrin repeat domain-containing protein [Wolbachia sp.]
MSIKNNLIIKAIERNKTEVVKQSLNLLKKLSNSFDTGQIRDKKGNTVLHYAVRNSNHELAQLFINKYKIDINLRNQHKQTPLTFAIGNFVTGVGGEENLSAVERLNRRFSRGDNLMIIDLLLRSGAKFDMAEHNYLLGIIKNQKSNNEYVPLCERIEETLGSILGKKQEKGYVRYENLDYTGHIHNIPEYGNSSQYGILGYDNIDDYTSEHIYEDIDELRDNKEELSSNIHMSRSSSVSSINSDNTWSSWDNNESKCQTLSNPQSDNEKRSWTPESGYRSGDDTDQQKSKIAALPSYQSNIGKPLISPKPANSKENYVKNMAKMFENKTSPSLNDSCFKSDGPSSKVLSGSIKKVLNRSNFLLETLSSR